MNAGVPEVVKVKPTLVYIYGPPASGKLTVGEKVAELAGYNFFHNHLTVNAIRSVFAFGSEAFTEVLHRLRLDVFETAARAGISLIFTNNSAWGGPDGRTRFAAFAAAAERVVEAQGGRTVFVRLSAPVTVLEERVADDSRRAHRKLLDVGRLRELMSELDETPVHPGDLSIDTSMVSPEAAARTIVAALR
jgi:predicted kinase